MSKIIIRSLLLTILFSILQSTSSLADIYPVLNNGQKWRIGYYEGGAYSDYTETMRTMVDGLIKLGWIKEQNPPQLSGNISKPYLHWLMQAESPYLSFNPDDWYSAYWDEPRRKRIHKELLIKLQNNALDLVIAMGTWSGIDLANTNHKVPVLVLSTSDPISAGIIKSIDNSGFDHVTARVDPTRYLRQIKMFHRIVGFKTLGVAYENTPDGRIYSAIKEVKQVGRERKFNVILCELIDTTTNLKQSENSCLECYRQLSQEADAVYVTALTCVDRQPAKIANVFKTAGKPSFSMIGSKFVEKGLMLSISNDSGYIALGEYNALKFDKILRGVKPIALNQVFEDPLNITINMETVRKIGFTMPISILKIASKVYQK